MRSTQLNPVARILIISLLLNVIMEIRTMFISLSSAVMSLATRLPIMMADDDDNYKDKFKYIIIAIVVLVVGAVTVSIVSGVGIYILNVFNTTAVKIPANYNFVSPIAPTLGSIFQILVVVLIIVALIFVIRYLMKSTDTF
jgi:predicted membrane protein